jgi:hypothetical protein
MIAFRVIVHAAAAFLLTAAVAPTFSAPIVLSVGFSTDRYAPNTVPNFVGLVGNRTQWNISVTTTGNCGGVTGTFSRGASGPFDLFLQSDPIFSNCLFSRNSTARSEADLLTFAGSTDPWSFTMTDATGSVSGLFPLIANPQLLPFATNIGVSDSSLTPLVTWSLPDLAEFDVDRVRLRVLESTGLQVFQRDLAPSATSFLMPGNVLQQGRSYFYRVILEDLEGGMIENRSNAFSESAFRVPEPATLALLLAGFAGLAATRRRAIGVPLLHSRPGQ